MADDLTIINVGNPEHALRWPLAAVSDEVDRCIRTAGTANQQWSESVERLLSCAFAGRSLAQEFRALRGEPSWDDPFAPQRTDDDTRRNWLVTLRAELPDAATADVKEQPYWSQRRGAKAELLDLQDTIRRFANVLRRLQASDALWTEVFGVDCPDDQYLEPSPDELIAERLGRSIAGTDTFPFRASEVAAWRRDDLFDVIEVLHDFAAWPRQWHDHSYGGCGGHPDEWSKATGQTIYRSAVNAVLAASALGVRLADSGEDRGRIVVSDEPWLEDEVEAALRDAQVSHRHAVEHAVALFRSRERNVDTMRSAIVTLGRLIEPYRHSVMKREFVSKDTEELFVILNKFDLRHRDADQRTDYDPAFLQWLFHWYLATVALLGELDRRAVDSEDTPGT